MSKTDRTLGLLGLSRKAGKTASGDFQVTEALQSGVACLVLLARDASENTRKRFLDKSAFYAVDCLETCYSKQELGRAMGQEERSVAAVCDEGLAALVRQSVGQNTER